MRKPSFARTRAIRSYSFARVSYLRRKDHLRVTRLGLALNEVLNRSERRLTARIGKMAVERLRVAFKAEAEKNQHLFKRLYRQRDPYGWLASRTPIPQPGQQQGQ